MGLDVPGELVGTRIGAMAYMADMFLLSRVRLFVLGQIAGLRKAAMANGTFVRLVAEMGATMIDEAPACGEALRAAGEVARVGLNAGVGAHV